MEYELALQIANYFNELNHNCYTKKEILTEISVQYEIMIRDNDIDDLLELFTEDDSEEGKELLKELLEVTNRNKVYETYENGYEKYNEFELLKLYNSIIDKEEYPNFQCWMHDMLKMGVLIGRKEGK